MKNSQSALRAWSSLLGPDRVMPPAEAQRRFGDDTTGSQRCIAGALRPVDAEQVTNIVRIAAEHGVPLYPISTGRNWGYGSSQPASDDCVILDLSGLDRIRHFDREAGTVTVEPGVTQGQLAEFLKREQAAFLVPVSGAGPTASLLGNCLERGYGITPNADHFAAVNSLDVVLPDGSLYRGALSGLGGEMVSRVFKWGIGPYLDGLFTQGAFGVVITGTIALSRRPERVEAFLFRVDDEGLADAVLGVREILRRLPGVVGGINLMNRHRTLAMAIPYPVGLVAPDAVLPDDFLRHEAKRLGITAWTGFGTLYGTRRMVAAARAEIRACLRGRTRRPIFLSPSGARRIARIANALPSWLIGGLARQATVLASGLELVDGIPNETAMPLCYWRSGRQPESGRGYDPARDGCGLRWYAPLVPMDPTSVVRYVDMVTRLTAAHGVEPLITLTSLSERCFDSTVPLLFDRNDRAAAARTVTCHQLLRDQGCEHGWVPYRVATDDQHWLYDRDDPCWRMVAAIKRAIDPKCIIAPGRYAPIPQPLIDDESHPQVQAILAATH